MTDKAVRYYLDKDKQVDFIVDCHNNGLYVSIYNDKNNSCIGYFCNKKELKGLADFIYDLLEKNDE